MKKILLILIICSCLPLIDLLHSGLPLTHDGVDHVARIANFYQNLNEGIIIPRWAANLNWGYGHPVLMFLYPLPSYSASFFHFFGFSLVNSVKIVFGFAFILSGLTMFLWINEAWGSYPALIAGLLYLYAPYRFVDLYVRGAIGEHLAFVFPPLILYFLLRLTKKNNYFYIVGASISLSGLILSHNAISIMFIPIIILYFLYLFWQSKQRIFLLKNFIFILILGFGISSFFWIPAFFEGKYTLRNIVTSGDYSTRFVEIKDFFSTLWSYGGTTLLSKQVGVVHWIILFLSIPITIFFFMKNLSKGVILLGSIIIFLSSLFIMTGYSVYLWNQFSIIQKFQFPWRFLSITIFITAVMGGMLISVFRRKLQLIFCIIIFISLLIANQAYWHAQSYSDKPESFYTTIYNGTTDTGESSPVWSVRFMEQRAKAHAEIISGKAAIDETERKTTEHIYRINAKTKAQIRENTLYFPGWTVLVDGKNIPVEFQDAHSRGIMTFWVDRGIHTISVNFTETKLRLISDTISLVSLFFLVLMYIGYRYRRLLLS
jgi:uncharacterized membrane protein